MLLKEKRRIRFIGDMQGIIQNGFPDMKESDAEAIAEYLVEDGIYAERVKESKGGILWRLLFPFYLLFGLIIFASMPIKWLITGSSRYSMSSLIGYVIDVWTDKYF